MHRKWKNPSEKPFVTVHRCKAFSPTPKKQTGGQSVYFILIFTFFLTLVGRTSLTAIHTFHSKRVNRRFKTLGARKFSQGFVNPWIRSPCLFLYYLTRFTQTNRHVCTTIFKFKVFFSKLPQLSMHFPLFGTFLSDCTKTYWGHVLALTIYIMTR